jgi:hypothetical protein
VVHVETDDKLEPRAEEGTFVGYIKSANQFWMMDKQDREIKVTNPIFIEDEPGWLS